MTALRIIIRKCHEAILYLSSARTKQGFNISALLNVLKLLYGGTTS